MWQQFVKAFFIGQVVCEQVSKAAQEAFASTKVKTDDQVERVSTQLKEATVDKGARLVEQFQDQCKDVFINLRQSNPSLEKACESLSRLLVETADNAAVSSALD
jgi:hypothetical protein